MIKLSGIENDILNMMMVSYKKYTSLRMNACLYDLKHVKDICFYHSSIILEVLTIVIKEEKEIRHIQIRKKGIKLFVYNIVYVANLKDYKHDLRTSK